MGGCPRVVAYVDESIMTDEIKWLQRPKRVEFRRVPWADCPPFIRKAFSSWKPLYEFVGPEDLAFVWHKYLVRVRHGNERKQGPICDLASVPWWVPPMLASRNTASNYLDVGALVHDLIHLGCASFPGVESRRQQGILADALMLALWKDALPEDAGWWKRGKPRRKWLGVRAAAPFLFRPDPDNLKPEWITISDMSEESQFTVEEEK